MRRKVGVRPAILQPGFDLCHLRHDGCCGAIEFLLILGCPAVDPEPTDLDIGAHKSAGWGKVDLWARSGTTPSEAGKFLTDQDVASNQGWLRLPGACKARPQFCATSEFGESGNSLTNSYRDTSNVQTGDPTPRSGHQYGVKYFVDRQLTSCL